MVLKTPTPTRLPTAAAGQTGRFGGGEKGSPPGEIPATGPNEVVWLILTGSALAGITLKKLSR